MWHVGENADTSSIDWISRKIQRFDTTFSLNTVVESGVVDFEVLENLNMRYKIIKII